MLTVNYSDLSNAFEFVSSDSLGVNNAYICADSGTIYWASSLIDLEEDIPEDLESSDRYIAVPHKNEFNLGQSLALAFVDKEIPYDYNTVAGYFRKRGAYRRFKELLQSQGLIDKWFEFESNASNTALMEWCQDNEIQLSYVPN